MANLSELSIGTKVRVYDAPDMPRDGVICKLQDKPGKKVGVSLSQHHPLAHECDGACPKGHGWWTTAKKVAVI